LKQISNQTPKNNNGNSNFDDDIIIIDQSEFEQVGRSKKNDKNADSTNVN
jgi:hypothetical protein